MRKGNSNAQGETENCLGRAIALRFKGRILLTLVLALFAFGPTQVQAADDFPASDDPFGSAGAFKPQVETGGSYNPHNGNGTRSVTDLEVPGAVGSGLKFTRHWNSTDESFGQGNSPFVGAGPFGYGGWTHSWNWVASLDQRMTCEDCSPQTMFTNAMFIKFPDGKAARFESKSGTQDYAAWPDWMGGMYSGDYMVGMDPVSKDFWLYVSDGSAVLFRQDGSWQWHGILVIDPNGLRTTLSYNAAGELETITGPDGRQLRVRWAYFEDEVTGNWAREIWKVESGTGAGYQAVEYSYAWPSGAPALGGATYLYGGDTEAHRVAGEASSYTYQWWESDDVPGTASTAIDGYGALLLFADDSRFEGPMTSIRYTFRGGPGGEKFCDVPTPPNPVPPYHPYLSMVPFPIETESSGTTGLLVSGFSIPCNGQADTGTRKEIRGAGGARLFYYGRRGLPEPGAPAGSTGDDITFQLTRMTQFSDDPASAPFEFCRYFNWQPLRTIDARGTLTRYEYEPSFRTNDPFFGGPAWVGRLDGTSRVKRIIRQGADNSTREFNRTNSAGSEARDPARLPNPYKQWLYSDKDERGHTTTYTRDSRRRVTRITYHDGSWEEFAYNDFNQITYHRMASDAKEWKEYDTRGLLLREWNSVDGPEARKEYTYDAFDRVLTMQDGRARDHEKDFSTRMTYNARHQVLTVEYAGMLIATDNPTVRYGYDAYGNCTSITNELGKMSTYAYDSYRRCIRYTEPLHAPNWNNTGSVATRTWNWHYDRWHEGAQSLLDASTHTSKQWRVQIEPAFNAAGERRLTARKFDYSDRIVEEVTGMIEKANGEWAGTADTGVRLFTYDANGNKKSSTDELGRLTTHEYDRRDRLVTTVESANTLPRTTTTAYDATSNKLLVTLPDMRTQQWPLYDPFGQALRFIDERGNATDLTYQWGPMKKLDQVKTYRTRDPESGGGLEPQLTDFEPDLLGRPHKITFPDLTREVTTYKFGQVETFTTRGNQAKFIHYDARGREDSNSWENPDGTCDPAADNGNAPCIAREWDPANRLAKIRNKFSIIDYRYDDAGQVLGEKNRITGSGAEPETNFYRYPSGEVGYLQHPNGLRLRKAYTARGQLQTVGLNNSANRLVDYYYLPDGKVNYSTYWNGVSTTRYGYDGRGMIGTIDHVKTTESPQGPPLAKRTYWRDDRDRIWAWQRGTNATLNGKENGTGNKFQYDAEGQLTDAWYLAQDPAGNMQNPVAQEHFKYDQLGNRTGDNVLNGYGTRKFLGRDNGLNQYLSWGSWPANYDANLTWPANGVLMQEGNITAGFNALNQPLFISGPVHNGTQNWMHFGFDPLGRCVKRWEGPLVNGWIPPPETNPATYFLYDGWNMIEEGPGGGGVARVYVHGARVDEIVVSSNSTGAVLFHHYDALGNCILLSDGAGNLFEQYDYEAFGKPFFYDPAGTEITSSPWKNRFLGKGREWLADLKLYDYRHRLYQPELGRFLQPDPLQFLAGDLNLYRYCHNDPINKSDPTGQIVIVDDVVIGGVIVGAAAAAYLSTPAGQKMVQDAGRALINLVGGLRDKLSHNTEPKFIDIPDRFAPPVGAPGTTVRAGEQSRRYGPDGYPETDRDRPHQGDKPPGNSDHAHDWGRPPGGGQPRDEDRGDHRDPKPGDPPPPRNHPPESAIDPNA